MDPRHNARRVALATLFSWSVLSQNIKEALATAAQVLELDSYDAELAQLIITGITENKKYLDELISKTAPEWPIDQIAKVDLVILRIATFELVIAQNVPPKVAIDEAVELAKEFGTDNSSKFVNGVLGTIVEEQEIET